MNIYKLKCQSCGITQEAKSDKNDIVAAKSINWGYVFNLENGMTVVHFCPECYTKAKNLATALHDIVKLDLFHLNSLLKG